MVCALAACTAPRPRAPAVPQVHTQVTTFQQLPSTVAGMKFAFTPFDQQVTSLEFATYAAQMRAALLDFGMIDSDIQDADIAVGFAYTIDSGRQITIDTPIHGQTGVSSSTTTGTVNDSGVYNATTTYTPTYGVTGYRHRPATIYTREIIIRMVDNKRSGNGKVIYLYTADVVSTGYNDSLAIIVPRMIEATFTEFPAGNGTVRKLSTPCPACDRN